jgi:hypothetical protein
MSTQFDSDSDAIMARMTAARKKPQSAPPPVNPNYKPLIFNDNDSEIDPGSSVFGAGRGNMMNYIADRRKQSELEMERFNTLGADEYNRQTYGGKQYKMQLGYNEDGLPNNEIMTRVMKSHMANSQVTADAMLDGRLETDISFLEGHDDVDGLNFLTVTGAGKDGMGKVIATNPNAMKFNGQASQINQTHVGQSNKPAGQPNKSVGQTHVGPSKEIHLKYNERKKLPLLNQQIGKIRIIVEYKEDMNDNHKKASMKIVKSGPGKENKTMDLEIIGEGKILTGHSYIYFFQSFKDGYTDVTINITGPGVVEASLIVS